MTGMCGRGDSVISLPGTSDQAWVQARVLRPPTFTAQLPQTPSRHDRRMASVGSTVFLI